MAKDSRNQVIEAIYFNGDAKEVKDKIGGEKLNVLFYPSFNYYNGKTTKQLEIKDYKIRKA